MTTRDPLKRLRREAQEKRRLAERLDAEADGIEDALESLAEGETESPDIDDAEEGDDEDAEHDEGQKKR